MHGAQRELDRASHNIATAGTEPYRPLQPDATLGAPGTLDLVAEIAATVTAPVLYAANARVLRADDRMRASLVDVRA
jgi:flagellar basal body rod protein FlgG